MEKLITFKLGQIDEIFGFLRWWIKKLAAGVVLIWVN